MSVASRREARKAAGQAAQKAGKYKGVRESSAATRARSRASERRRKAAKQAAAKAAAIEKIKAAEKAAAEKAAAAREANVGVGAPPPRQAPEIDPRVIASQQAEARQAQARFAAQADAARKERERSAALQRAANQQRSSAISQIKAAEQSVNRFPKIKPQPKPEGMSLSRAKAGLYNLLPEFLRTDNKSGRTAEQQAFHDSIHGADARRDRRRKRKERQDQVVPLKPTPEIDDFRDRFSPEIVDEFPPVMPPFDPRFPQYPGMSGGLGAFGYSPASLMFESQQGAGQVPYYMAAARNAMNPNLSPAFMNAARNYDILGGMQRVMPRPIEMMSARERGEIMDMGSNFSVPNYNSPYYQPSPQSQFDFFNNMVGRGGGKGMGRPMSQPMARAMAGGLGSFFGGFM